jgi:hypothetical protein
MQKDEGKTVRPNDRPIDSALGEPPRVQNVAGAVRAMFKFALFATLISAQALAEPLSPEADACKASGLIALKQKSPQVKDVQIDLDSARVINADTKIEDVPVKTVVIGEAYIERSKSQKPQTFFCIIGEKGKVLLTLFSDK